MSRLHENFMSPCRHCESLDLTLYLTQIQTRARLAAAHKKTGLAHDENANSKTTKSGLATKPGTVLAKKETSTLAGTKKRSALGDVSNVQSQVSIVFVFQKLLPAVFMSYAFSPDVSDYDFP